MSYDITIIFRDTTDIMLILQHKVICSYIHKIHKKIFSMKMKENVGMSKPKKYANKV